MWKRQEKAEEKREVGGLKEGEVKEKEWVKEVSPF